MEKPASSYSIRPATGADIEAMRALERRAAQLFRTIGFDFCADGPIRDVAEHMRALECGLTLVAETAEGLIAGFAMFEPLDGDTHLIEIDVDPAHQKRGVARRLIAAGEAYARLKGFDGMTLTTYRDVPWNAPYYRRLGFEDFRPGPEREGLIRTINEEADLGFAFAPRIAMRKRLL
jgi:GNAT superfamily N-acetyltransferase